MPELFSLLRRAWLPVALDDGRRVFVRPCDISEPHEGRAIVRVATGRPDCDISLTEFLIGLLAVTMDGTSHREWAKHYRNPPSRAALEAAFAPLEPAMVLDGDGPRFFQDLESLEGAVTPVEAFFMDAPAEHFVKPGRTQVLSRAGAAIALATLQTSAPAGGAGHRTSLRGGGPLTTLVLPGHAAHAEPSLWQRLWSNVPERLQAEPEDYKRVFPWLGPTRISDRSGVATTPEDVHPAQAFFGLPRRIRLAFEPNTQKLPCDQLGIVDDVIVTGYITRPWGTNYTSWSKGHPLSPYYKPKPNEPEFLPLHLKSSRVGYRQFLGMVLENPDGSRVPARSVDEFRSRAQNFEGEERRALRDCRLLVAGYAMDKMKPLDFAEALVPLFVTGSEIGDQHVKDAAKHVIGAATLVASQLSSAVKRALYGERGDVKWDSTVLEGVQNRFWSDTEQEFYARLSSAAQAIVTPDGGVVDDPHSARRAHNEAWLAVIARHALAIFDDAVPIEDAESAKIADVIEGRKMLGSALVGSGPVGRKLFAELGLPEKEPKTKKGKKAA